MPEVTPHKHQQLRQDYIVPATRAWLDEQQHSQQEEGPEMRALSRCALASVLLIVAGCGQGPVVPTASPVPPSIATAEPAATPAETVSASTAPDPLASPVVMGAFEVDDTGRKLAMECWGSGSPAVFLESGGGALDEMKGSNLVRDLAAETKVCLYNRAGLEPSDPAPNRKREAEDVAADLHALVRAAHVSPPLVLFGRSFGGMLTTFYAATYPDDVAGVVVFDSPAPSATLSVADFREGVWDADGSVEHIDVLYGMENRFGKKPVHIDAPLILVSTTAGESRPDDTYWLQVSDDSKQVVLTGGMEVIDQQASKLADQILSLVRAARGS